jgi:DNA-binding response OmpR family regulator
MMTSRPSAGTRVLIIDDDERLNALLTEYLCRFGFSVRTVSHPDAGLRALKADPPDLLILDIMLPETDGLAVCRKVREISRVPIVMLTARGDVTDRIVGLELGADDYLGKPFGLRELMSRIKALLRRAYGDLADAAGGRVIRHHDLVIDLERRRVQRGARRISLTATEFEILRHLASRPGRVFSRRELLELVRDYEALDQDEKTINVHVSHLRDKIEDDPASPAFVLTVRGVGYAFAER